MPKKQKRKLTEANADIFTPAAVVDYMLDAVEVDLGRTLSYKDRVLEPSAGDGAFVLPLVDHIVRSLPQGSWNAPSLEASLLAFETNPHYAATLRTVIGARLREAGCPAARMAELISAWIREEDFLVAEIDGWFDAVVGNPPYVRYDAIGADLVATYQRTYPTFRGRCDLYVPFIERSLRLLAPAGAFCFICSNRFVKSEYGRRLRALISGGFHTALYLNLEHADVFGHGVAAYPAILLVDRHCGKPTHAASVVSLSVTPLSSYRLGHSALLDEFPAWYRGDEPWMATDATTFRYRREIAACLPTLADSASGTCFGIGVATGNDAIFVRPGREPDIEPDCLLPLVTGDDVRAGIPWGGAYLVNPYRPDASGALWDLDKRPGLARYLERNRNVLERRFVARQKGEWFRTIDRVNWSLFKRPKLLLPDIQKGGVVGLDRDGSLYPHHNLYWVVSDGWPLDLLAAFFKSRFVTSQIRWASSEMRGGSIRYQAKNLECLRLPPRNSVSEEEERILVDASNRMDVAGLNEAVDRIVARCLAEATPVYASQAEQLLLLAMESNTEYDAKPASKRLPTPLHHST